MGSNRENRSQLVHSVAAHAGAALGGVRDYRRAARARSITAGLATGEAPRFDPFQRGFDVRELAARGFFDRTQHLVVLQLDRGIGCVAGQRFALPAQTLLNTLQPVAQLGTAGQEVGARNAQRVVIE